MKLISLQHTLPEVFSDRNHIVSDIWHKEVVFEKGKKYLIEAASGVGKSSLCSFIYGHRSDYQGIIRFDETNIKRLSHREWTTIRKGNVSLLFQDLKLFPELSVWENIQIKNNLTHHRKEKEIISFLERLDIIEKKDQKVGKLSFGQQQRVAIIRAVCQPFDFIFLDEPISHLDDENGRLVSELLTDVVNENSAGLVVTSIGKHPVLNYEHILRL